MIGEPPPGHRVAQLVAVADDVVAVEQAAARLPHAELVAFGREAAHEILREEDGVRERALAAIDSFLDRAAPGAQG